MLDRQGIKENDNTYSQYVFWSQGAKYAQSGRSREERSLLRSREGIYSRAEFRGSRECNFLVWRWIFCQAVCSGDDNNDKTHLNANFRGVSIMGLKVSQIGVTPFFEEEADVA